MAHPVPVPNGGPCGAAGSRAGTAGDALGVRSTLIWYEDLPIGEPAPGPRATGVIVFHHVLCDPAAGAGGPLMPVAACDLAGAVGRRLTALLADGRRYLVRQGPVRRLPDHDRTAEYVQELLVLLLDPFQARPGEYVAPDNLPLPRGPFVRWRQPGATDLVLRRLAALFDGIALDVWQRVDGLPSPAPVSHVPGYVLRAGAEATERAVRCGYPDGPCTCGGCGAQEMAGDAPDALARSVTRPRVAYQASAPPPAPKAEPEPRPVRFREFF